MADDQLKIEDLKEGNGPVVKDGDRTWKIWSRTRYPRIRNTHI